MKLSNILSKVFLLVGGTILTNPVTADSSDVDVVLTAPIVTDFGQWTSWAECDPDHFVVAADLYHSATTNTLEKTDDLGLINVVLECQNFLDKEAPPQHIFTQMEGVSASISFSKTDSVPVTLAPPNPPNVTAALDADQEPNIDIEYSLPLRTRCNGLAVGFSINSAKKEFAKDNSAANNLRLYCSNLRQSAPSYVEAYGLYEGEWSEEQLCGAEHAICGIQAQADSLLMEDVDHKGLNSLRFKCCRVPNPASTCTPTDTWELVAECDNIESSSNSPLTCTYTQSVGIGASSTKLRQEYEDYLLNEGLGFNLEQGEVAGSLSTPFWLATALSENFRQNLGTSPDTNHDWGVTSERTWNAERVTENTVEVDMALKAYIYQVVGKCSYFTARTGSLRRVDSNSPIPFKTNGTQSE